MSWNYHTVLLPELAHGSFTIQHSIFLFSLPLSQMYWNVALLCFTWESSAQWIWLQNYRSSLCVCLENMDSCIYIKRFAGGSCMIRLLSFFS